MLVGGGGLEDNIDDTDLQLSHCDDVFIRS